MPSLIYNSFLDGLARGRFDLSADTIKVLLTGSSYAESKDGHAYRSDVTDEVTGTGYTAGGAAVTVSLALDTAADWLTMTFGAVTWPSSTFTARKAVYYKSRGGSASADELLFCVVFDNPVAASGGTLTLQQSSVRLSNFA